MDYWKRMSNQENDSDNSKYADKYENEFPDEDERFEEY